MTKQDLIDLIEPLHQVIIFEGETMTIAELRFLYNKLAQVKRRLDGQDFIDTQAALLIDGGMSDTDMYQLTQNFAGFKQLIGDGWWTSALIELNNMESPTDLCATMIGQFTTIVTNYINQNYLPDNITAE